MRTSTAVLVGSLLVAAAIVCRGVASGGPLEDAYPNRLDIADERLDDLELRLQAIEGKGSAKRPTAETAAAAFAALRKPESSGASESAAKSMWIAAYVEASGSSTLLASAQAMYDTVSPRERFAVKGELARAKGRLLRDVLRCQAAERDYAEAGGK